MGMSKKTNNRRVYSGSGPRPDNTKFKREEAATRQAAYDKMSPKEKLDRLDEKFGKNVGAAKERMRLTTLLEKGKKVFIEKIVEFGEALIKSEETFTEEMPKKMKAKDRRKKEKN